MNVVSDTQTLLVPLCNHRPFNTLLRFSYFQQISSEVQNANNFKIPFHDIEGKNIAEKWEVTI